jgi:putative ABC transport system substrate-binding protein
MRRRGLIALALLVVAAAASAAVAQQAKLPRIVYLDNASSPMGPSLVEAFFAGLADAGYVHGTTAVIEKALAATTADFAAIAAKAVASQPDVLLNLSTGTPGLQALLDATKTIPIVGWADMLGSGFVPSLARPGGNVTGLTTFNVDLGRKRMALLKETVSAVTRVGILYLSDNPGIAREAVDAANAATELGLVPVMIDFNRTQPFVLQLPRVADARIDAVYVAFSSFFGGDNRQPLCDLLIRNRLPSMSANVTPPFCPAISYGPSQPNQFRRMGSYVDAILKGAKPADLPVEQPTVFDFVVNLNTARALGLMIPQSILLQATQVIE